MFADAPHLLKLLRNWLLDTGFELKDGSVLKKDILTELIESGSTEISSLYKLTSRHLEVKKAQRQNVLLAVQLLSHTTATALKHYFHNATEEKKIAAIKLGEFIDLFNSWFDLMNTFAPAASTIKSPYGMYLKGQNKLLSDVLDTVSTMRCLSKNTMQVFQKGFIISIKSIQSLFTDLQEKYKILYLLTHRLNQDCLENFFSQVRNYFKIKSYI